MICRLILLFFLTTTIASCNNDNKTTNKKNEESSPSSIELAVDSAGLSTSSIVIRTVHGNITFKLYATHAPNTARRIVELTKEGFYDGLTFHRVVPNFVVQGGDPQGNGTGGSGRKLKAEFNDLQHIRGTVAMARSQDPDSADSQFYIALSTLPHLDKKYTIFGQVVDGIDLIDKIFIGDKIISMSFIEAEK
jgi:cyclophilin family peptidyl-prolyl cis-trans isomerase